MGRLLSKTDNSDISSKSGRRWSRLNKTTLALHCNELAATPSKSTTS
jgi:hypothetical protein